MGIVWLLYYDYSKSVNELLLTIAGHCISHFCEADMGRRKSGRNAEKLIVGKGSKPSTAVKSVPLRGEIGIKLELLEKCTSASTYSF